MKKPKFQNKFANLLFYGFCSGLILFSNTSFSALATVSSTASKDSALITLLKNANPTTAEDIYGVLQSFGALNNQNKEKALSIIKNSYQNYISKNPQNNKKDNIELYKKIEISLLSENNLLSSSFISTEKLNSINKQKEENLNKEKATLQAKKEQDAKTAKIRTEALEAIKIRQNTKNPSVLSSPEEAKFITVLGDKVPLDTYKIYEALETKKILKQEKLNPEEAKKRKESIKQIITDAIKSAQEKREKTISPSVIKSIQTNLTQKGFVN